MAVDDEIDPDLIEDDEEINDAHASSPPKNPPSPASSSTSSEVGSEVNSEDERPSLPLNNQDLVNKFFAKLATNQRDKSRRKALNKKFNQNWLRDLQPALNLFTKFSGKSTGDVNLEKAADNYKKAVDAIIKLVRPPKEAHNQVALALLNEPAKQAVMSLGQELHDDSGFPTLTL